MMFVESQKVYTLRKLHASDTIAMRARKVLKACRQGDGIYCRSLVEVNTVKRFAYKQTVPVIMRKQPKGGWIVYPLFYKSPKYKEEYDEKRKALRKEKHEDSTQK